MAITGLTLTLDRTYYSRFEPTRAVLRATVTPVGTGDPVTVTLTRQTPAGPLVLATQDLPALTGPETVTFDLRTLLTSAGYPSAIRSRALGDYTVTATHGTTPSITAAATATVLLITPEEMRRTWLLGLSLRTVEMLMPRTQPTQITGVAITSVGTQSRIGGGALAWNFTTKALTWRGGAAVPINMSGGTQAYALPDPLMGYLLVSVTPGSLPGVDTTETVTLDFGTLTDDALATIMHGVTDEIERGLLCRLEPTRIVTECLIDASINPSPPAAYDEVMPGTSWYRPEDYYRWLSIKLPVHQVREVVSLSGWFNRSRTVEIPESWITLTAPMIGLVELIPANVAIVQWYYYGPWMPALVSAAGHVGKFWQYDIIAGLREIPEGLRLFLAKRQALAILAIAGQARNPSGQTGGGLSRDGISESRSLHPMGVYGALMRQYSDETGLTPGTRAWTLDNWREKLAGPVMVVL